MTNKEILRADLLDILFENRNKAYGAYALRKTYSHRLQWALGIGLSFALLLSMLNLSHEKKYKEAFEDRKELKISSITLPEEKKIDPPKQKTQPQTKQVTYTNQIKLVSNNTKVEMPDIKDILSANISDKTTDGIPPTGIVQTTTQDSDAGTVIDKKNEGNVDFHPTNSDAQFPGGKDAFTKFLSKHLVTPGELEAGEKKIVLVRFMVDADGTISKTEILQSDGNEYSKEVIRVLNKMPKWIPAMQNGTKVATWFTQPVSFIGVE